MRLHHAACCICLTAVLMSCDTPERQLNASATSSSPVEQAASNKTLAESFGNDFADATGGPMPPSYEVAIASAAADQTRGLEACQEKPVAEQKACKEEVNKVWAEASQAAQSARGNAQ